SRRCLLSIDGVPYVSRGHYLWFSSPRIIDSEVANRRLMRTQIFSRHAWYPPLEKTSIYEVSFLTAT
ncbi:hypothetical protein MKW98_000787, partial [Papaver atlanticum]